MNCPWRRQVERFSHQYLQLQSDLDFPQAEYLRLDEVQDELHTSLFSKDGSNVGPPVRYRLTTLKELVSRIESSIDDWEQYAVSDDIMSALCTTMAMPLPSEAVTAQAKCYVTYHLSLLDRGDHATGEHATDNRARPCTTLPTITFLENHSLVSAGGTTGLRTWEAALHMGQYLCLNPSLVAGKRVLELGAGTGYLSVLCAKHLEAAHAIVSDGSDDVITNMPENLLLNGLQGSSRITSMHLEWGHALVAAEDKIWNRSIPVDVVLGADITYDQRAAPALVATLLQLFELYPTVKVYMAVTERNPKTFQAFLDASKREKLSVESLSFKVPPREQQNAPFYNDQAAIQLCRVSRAQR
ncbi:uncharacterized protein UV8b_07675 [Ustilaginoidea virens]|uniref:FAM86A protein n=1 Tax=Ustilaginoidea virens TaxID=1159556 RepID=A0A8E5HXG9_USTVR|nr:uncharacterized protein UV8b_07675 [Ustilaginoidea virens]QUC23434.1 hypothetical protein UV8b_07675 [Ustilaginoidea virens]